MLDIEVLPAKSHWPFSIIFVRCMHGPTLFSIISLLHSVTHIIHSVQFKMDTMDHFSPILSHSLLYFGRRDRRTKWLACFSASKRQRMCSPLVMSALPTLTSATIFFPSLIKIKMATAPYQLDDARLLVCTLDVSLSVWSCDSLICCACSGILWQTLKSPVPIYNNICIPICYSYGMGDENRHSLFIYSLSLVSCFE